MAVLGIVALFLCAVGRLIDSLGFKQIKKQAWGLGHRHQNAVSIVKQALLSTTTLRDMGAKIKRARASASAEQPRSAKIAEERSMQTLQRSSATHYSSYAYAESCRDSEVRVAVSALCLQTIESLRCLSFSEASCCTMICAKPQHYLECSMSPACSSTGS